MVDGPTWPPSGVLLVHDGEISCGSGVERRVQFLLSLNFEPTVAGGEDFRRFLWAEAEAREVAVPNVRDPV